MTPATDQIGSRGGPAPEDQEPALWRKSKEGGSALAREALFRLHHPFARRLARKHFLDRKSGDIELQDLEQLASAGLLEAIDKYDPSLGAPFQAYARRRISGSIIDGLSKASEVREQISFRNRIRRERIRSLDTEDVEALPAADALEALIEMAVGLALGFMLDGTGLYAEGGSRPAQPTASAYDSVIWRETLTRLATEMEALPDRERTILRTHYVDGLDFERVGQLLGVTKGRVSQIHRAALALLRRRLGAAGDFKLER